MGDPVRTGSRRDPPRAGARRATDGPSPPPTGADRQVPEEWPLLRDATRNTAAPYAARTRHPDTRSVEQ